MFYLEPHNSGYESKNRNGNDNSIRDLNTRSEGVILRFRDAKYFTFCISQSDSELKHRIESKLSAPYKHLCKFNSFHISQFGCIHILRIPCSAFCQGKTKGILDVTDSLPNSSEKLGCKVSKTSQGLFPLSMFTSNQRHREAWKLPGNLVSLLPPAFWV